MHLDEAVERFLTHLSATRAAHTVNAYGTDLAQFVEYALGAGIEQVQHLNERLVRSWLDSFRAASRRTRERKLYCLRAFFRYCRTWAGSTATPARMSPCPCRSVPCPAC
jgi:site-specific recombinase XerD